MTPESITILMLGGGKKVSFAHVLKDSGKRLGIDVVILSYDLSKEVPIALEGEVVVGKPWHDSDTVDDVCNVARLKNVSIILPMVNGAIEVALKCRKKLPGVFIPVTEFSEAEALFDKAEAAKLFKKENFPIPRTYSVLSAQMPAIAKPRKGGSSKGIKIFTDIDDLMDLKDLSDYIVQEYIPNYREYTVDCYIDSAGNILATVPRERIEVLGGESVKTRTCRNSLLEDFSHQIIDRLKLRGPVNLQFIHDLDTDRYLLLEVNPRLGGAVICSILAGAPIADYIIKESLNLPLEKCDDWKDGTLMARYFKEAVFFNS